MFYAKIFKKTAKKTPTKQKIALSYQLAQLVVGAKGKHSLEGEVYCRGSDCRVEGTYEYKW